MTGRSSPQAPIAIVLGSGLGSLASRCDRILEEVSFTEAGLPVSTVPGHGGRLVCGELDGQPVWMMQGRVHLYEGHGAQAVTAGVRWLAQRGVRTLLLTNAAGCLNPAFAPGEWMMLSDHLNLTGTSPFIGGPHFHDMSSVYSPRLRKAFLQCAFDRGLVLRDGVYAGVTGPQYETPAEVRMLRHLGADAVGMSTVLEAIQAHALGLEVAGFSCLTNLAAGLAASPLNHAEVMAAGHAAAENFLGLLVDWVRGEVRRD
ncbi:MAG: purine-nucleoside phosphorylase [Verrucomicrobiales bacterium]